MAKFSRHDSRNQKAGRKKKQVQEGVVKPSRRPRGEDYAEKRAVKYGSFREYYEDYV